MHGVESTKLALATGSVVGVVVTIWTMMEVNHAVLPALLALFFVSACVILWRMSPSNRQKAVQLALVAVTISGIFEIARNMLSDRWGLTQIIAIGITIFGLGGLYYGFMRISSKDGNQST